MKTLLLSLLSSSLVSMQPVVSTVVPAEIPGFRAVGCYRRNSLVAAAPRQEAYPPELYATRWMHKVRYSPLESAIRLWSRNVCFWWGSTDLTANTMINSGQYENHWRQCFEIGRRSLHCSRSYLLQVHSGCSQKTDQKRLKIDLVIKCYKVIQCLMLIIIAIYFKPAFLNCREISLSKEHRTELRHSTESDSATPNNNSKISWYEDATPIILVLQPVVAATCSFFGGPSWSPGVSSCRLFWPKWSSSRRS